MPIAATHNSTRAAMTLAVVTSLMAVGPSSAVAMCIGWASAFLVPEPESLQPSSVLANEEVEIEFSATTGEPVELTVPLADGTSVVLEIGGGQ